MKMFRNFFSSAKDAPTHEEILERTQKILEGRDDEAKKIHDLKQLYNMEMIKINDEARKVAKDAHKTNKNIDTVYYVAKVTGGLI